MILCCRENERESLPQSCKAIGRDPNAEIGTGSSPLPLLFTTEPTRRGALHQDQSAAPE